LTLGVAVVGGLISSSCEPSGSGDPRGGPEFEVDPHWPQPLPNDWILGQVAGVAVDSRDHVWIVHRRFSLDITDTAAVVSPSNFECCVPAPAVVVFDQAGAVVRAWGGPEGDLPWPVSEHGVYVDETDHVWLAGNSPDAHVVRKFTLDGELVLEIGVWGETGGSNDTNRLGRPADIGVDVEAREVYVADGYGNRRIIVFDSESGAYKRHWGGYGEEPHDSSLADYDPAAPPLRSFRNPTHAVRLANDGLVYVADRVSNRLQVFQKSGEFVSEGFVAPNTLGRGTVWDLELSPDQSQTHVYVADGTNRKVWILTRADLEVVGSFGSPGRLAGQFNWVHNIAGDSFGNLYTTEVNTGHRVQRWLNRN
jgi:DNA-binding beta-propeller fold protein YncE